MAEQNVPPRRSHDDGRWDGRPHHTDGYRDAPYGQDHHYPAQGYGTGRDQGYGAGPAQGYGAGAADHNRSWHADPRQAGPYGAAGGYGPGGSAYGQDGSAYGQGGSAYGQGGSAYGQGGSAYGQDGSAYGQDGRWDQTATGYPAAPAGPQWIGPQGGGPATGGRDPHRDNLGLPNLDDDDDDRAKVGRRRALAVLGGAAAVVAGGAAVAMTPAGRDVAGTVLGDAGGVTAADAPTIPTVAGAIPGTTGTTATTAGGQRASNVRTYTEQNESYMGSRAGEKLKKNAPSGGRAYNGPAAAAAQTKPAAQTVLAHDPVRHLASRATFGATPQVMSDIEERGIDGWLRWQLDPKDIEPTKAEMKLSELPTLTLSIKELREQNERLRERDAHADRETIEATIARQIWSQRQLFEVMVDFWNDFLHVGPFFDRSDIQRASFDRDVIRKYALGSYSDMLVAANRHPALLTYLNQNQSSKGAVNENLARENLELYSVGVDGGYSETDVKQAALLQTGRSVRDDEYVYIPERHYVGKVKILGFEHDNASAEGGEEAGDSYFRYLANHSSTAKYIAQSLATRFVSDTPPKSLVDRLAKSYRDNDSAIKPVLMTLFSSSEFWASVGQKVRRPMEYLVATYRVLGVEPDSAPDHRRGGDSKRTAYAEGLRQIQRKMEELGQFPTGQPTPDGYPDVYVAWTSAGAMVNGWNEAGDLANGNRTVFTFKKPDELVKNPPTTAGDYLDALAQRLVHQKLTSKQKSLILDIAEVSASTRVDASFNGAIRAVVRALLASPQHHLR